MSSPLSFRTAREEVSFSAPEATLGDYTEENGISPPARRAAKELPFELREHCVIYFEESLYAQALTLLTNLLVAGTSSKHGDGLSPAFVAPPRHLALIATLVVHPSMTTRTSSIERLKASNSALRLLRAIHTLVGPANARLADAFHFGRSDRSLRRGGRDRRRTDNDMSAEDAEVMEEINTEIATTGSLWNRAEDFWHVVGWAFNCSVVHPERWERWRVWLESMLDVLEDDWKTHESYAETKRVEIDGGLANDDEEPAEEILLSSLISKYLQMDSRRYGGARRAVRAVFADASQTSLREFGEVFSNETRRPKQEQRQDVKVNIDEGVYGDYMDSDEEGQNDDTFGDGLDPVKPEPPTRNRESNGISSRRKEGTGETPHSTDDGDAYSVLGGVEAFKLRMRLLAILSAVSTQLSTQFTPLDSLHSVYSDHIRPLPLPAFAAIISPSLLPDTTSPFPPTARSSHTQFLLRSFISSSAPLPPASVSDDISQDILAKYYLPYPANTGSLIDNAKVSLLVEALLRMLNMYVGLDDPAGLERAVEAGIKAREAKIKPDGRKKSGGGGSGGAGPDGNKDGPEMARFLLDMSSMRLRALVHVAREAS